MRKLIALMAASVIAVSMSPALGFAPGQGTGGSPGKHQKGHIESQVSHRRQHGLMAGKRRHITSHSKNHKGGKNTGGKVHGKRKHEPPDPLVGRRQHGKTGHAAGTGRKG